MSGLPRGWSDEVRNTQTYKHTRTHPEILTCPERDSIHLHKDPKGIESNEDTEQGYHNKLNSVCELDYTRMFHAVIIK